MKRFRREVKEEWRFDKDNKNDMEYMDKLIKERRNDGYEIFESDFEDWDGGEIHYRDVDFSKIEYETDWI